MKRKTANRAYLSRRKKVRSLFLLVAGIFLITFSAQNGYADPFECKPGFSRHWKMT